jgi:predicted regulator of Ras-like GTPase activity (Roadblock/LC7/MglB family)
MSESSKGSGPLPTRRHTSRRDSPQSDTTVAVRPPHEADMRTMNEALQQIRSQVDRINGLLVATRDGLVVCSDVPGVEDDSVAAMAAATVGLAAQFTGQANVGEPRAVMFEGTSGHVCVFPLGDATLLVVFGEQDTTMGLFNVAARQALAVVQQAITHQKVRVAGDTR